MNNLKTFYLLSYPRSGNHWVRYILEWHSKRITCNAGNSESLSSYFVEVPGIKENLPPIAIKKHWIEDTDQQCFPMIFLVRNYKEAIPRHCEYNSEQYQSNLEMYRKDVYSFLNWTSPKICIYYEDLILDAKTAIDTILLFAGLPKNEEFLINLESHKKLCIKSYDRIEKSYTLGEHLNFHVGRLSEKEILTFDKFMSEAELSSVLARYY